MLLSTTQLLLRLALALLLPLWTRSAPQHEVLIVLLIVIPLTILAHRTHYTDNVDLVKDLIIAFGGTLIASYVADYAVVGSWLRLGITYLLSWDALWYLFPDTEHMIRVQAARQKSFTSSPILVSPLVFAATLTTYLGVCDYLNTQGSKCHALCIGLLVVCAIGGSLQHCAIAIFHAVAEQPTAPRLNDEDSPGLVKLELNITEPNASTTGESTSHIASVSVDGKEKYQTGGLLRPSKTDDWQLLMVEVLSDLPKVQGRPSTRRRG